MLYGFMTYIKGVKWLLQRPFVGMLLFIPLFFGVFMIYGLYELFDGYHAQIMSFLLFDSSGSFWMDALRWVCELFLKLAIYAFIVLLGFVGANIVSSPIYDYVSILVERSVTGHKEVEISFWKSLLLLPEELKKLVFILLISFLLMIIPGVNMISPFVTAFLLGWDFFDYPLARRGLSFKERKSLAFKSMWRILGLGFWLLVPFVQILLLPLAVSGGTMLGLEALENK